MKLIIAALLISFSFSVSAQNCDDITIYLKEGTINKLKLTATQEEIKKQLPCFTGSTEDGSEFINCGGGVFYLNNDFFFYSGKDYIEAREGYTGKFSIPVMGVEKDQAIKQLDLGEPVRTEINGGSETYYFFATTYGCLWIKIVEGKVNQIDISAQQAADIKLCL